VLRLLRAGADEGRAVVLVTHEAAAAAIADRVLRLDGGRLVRVTLALARPAARARRARCWPRWGVAASLVVGTASTVGYGLATGSTARPTRPTCRT
jgi:ABC-type nitrate/sulfonate/bicarbonate transport system ATPase subunit